MLNKPVTLNLLVSDSLKEYFKDLSLCEIGYFTNKCISKIN